MFIDFLCRGRCSFLDWMSRALRALKKTLVLARAKKRTPRHALTAGYEAREIRRGEPFCSSMIAKPGDEAARRRGPNLLAEFADKTRGLYFHARNDAEAQEAMMKAGPALRNEYMTGFRTAGF